MWGHDLSDLFFRGGGVMWPLLVCSIVAVAVAIERVVVLVTRYVSYDAFVAKIDSISQTNFRSGRSELAQCRSPLARVAEAYLDNRTCSREVRQKVVDQEASYQLTQLERRVHWLSVIGTVAPMIGLLGTVIGLVDAFHSIELLGGQVQPGDLAAGIWKALLTTVFGLAVALPTLTAYHFLDQRVGVIALQMEWLIVRLDKLFDNPLVDTEDTRDEDDVRVEVVASVGD